MGEKKSGKKRILVTGGAGFIGCHLILRLLKDGHEVICVDNMNEYYDRGLKEDRLKLFMASVKFYKLDITDREALKILFSEEKFDVVCHLAAQAGVRYSLENPFLYGETNYVGTMNILEFCRLHGVKHVVFASTSSVYGANAKMPFSEKDPVNDQVSVYASSKRACELLGSTYCHLYGMDFTALRFFTVYGPYGRPDMALFKFTQAILQDDHITVYHHGKMERDFTYVDDIVDGFVKAMEKQKGFQIFNLGAGKPIVLLKFIELLEKELGKKAKKKFVELQAGDVVKTYADISLAKKLLGYQPSVALEDGIKRFVEWYDGYYKK